MGNAVAVNQASDIAKIETVLMAGDLSVLNEAQRVTYYNKVCDTIGLNPLTKPFEYIRLNNKLVLYATKGCAEQLRMQHKVSLKIAARETIADVYVVTAEATNKDGRVDSATGAVAIKGLAGEALANAFMKAETKAKRRVTLSICGLNMLDETEVESIPPAAKGDPTLPVIRPQAPMEGDGVVTADRGYVVPFGKFQKRTLEEIDLEQLQNYIVYLENKAQKDGKPLSDVARDFVERASDYVASFENASSEEDAENAFNNYRP